jgi:hypothetical protein
MWSVLGHSGWDKGAASQESMPSGTTLLVGQSRPWNNMVIQDDARSSLGLEAPSTTHPGRDFVACDFGHDDNKYATAYRAKADRMPIKCHRH